MFKEEIDLVSFAGKHKIKVRIFEVITMKHLILDKELDYLKIKISRGRKSIIILRNQGAVCPYNDQDDLTSTVLESLQKFPPFPFEDYCNEFYGADTKTPIENIKKAYDMETSEYEQVMKLFPDIIDELIEIIQG